MFKVTDFYEKSYRYAKRSFYKFYYLANAISCCFDFESYRFIERSIIKKDGKLIARKATYTGV